MDKIYADITASSAAACVHAAASPAALLAAGVPLRAALQRPAACCPALELSRNLREGQATRRAISHLA